MGGANKEVSTLKKCKISADPKGRLNTYRTDREDDRDCLLAQIDRFSDKVYR